VLENLERELDEAGANASAGAIVVDEETDRVTDLVRDRFSKHYKTFYELIHSARDVGSEEWRAAVERWKRAKPTISQEFDNRARRILRNRPSWWRRLTGG
jgi:hypothetical protein